MVLDMSQGQTLTLEYGSIDLVKGYTKASVMAFVLMVASELDLESEWEKVLPFCDFLDRAFLLPCHVTDLKMFECVSSIRFFSLDPMVIHILG